MPYLFRPRAFNELWVKNLLPAMQTLNVCAAHEKLGDLLPVLALFNASGKVIECFVRYCDRSTGVDQSSIGIT